MAPFPVTSLLLTKAHWTFFSAFSPARATGLLPRAEVIFHRPGATVPHHLSECLVLLLSDQTGWPHGVVRRVSGLVPTSHAIFLISPLVQGGVVSLHQSSQGYPRLFMSFSSCCFFCCVFFVAAVVVVDKLSKRFSSGRRRRRRRVALTSAKGVGGGQVLIT